MDDFGDKLNAILNDPGALSRITDMAKSIMGGSDRAEKAEKPETPDLGIDPALLSRMASILRKSGGRDDKTALIEAMSPYLSDRRREKLRRALRLARLASLAGLAASEFGLGEPLDGEDGNV